VKVTFFNTFVLIQVFVTKIASSSFPHYNRMRNEVETILISKQYLKHFTKLTIIQILDNGLVQFLVPSFMMNNHNFWDQEPAKVNAEVFVSIRNIYGEQRQSQIHHIPAWKSTWSGRLPGRLG